MDKSIIKKRARLRRKMRVRRTVLGTSERPRLSVFRSLKHIYAQIINDETGRTLVQASSLSPEIKGGDGEGGKKEVAKKVGELVAQKALQEGITKICFDRGGYKYHGRVHSLADGARAKGLDF